VRLRQPHGDPAAAAQARHARCRLGLGGPADRDRTRRRFGPAAGREARADRRRPRSVAAGVRDPRRDAGRHAVRGGGAGRRRRPDRPGARHPYRRRSGAGLAAPRPRRRLLPHRDHRPARHADGADPPRRARRPQRLRHAGHRDAAGQLGGGGGGRGAGTGLREGPADDHGAWLNEVMSLLRAAVTVLATAALGLPGAGAAHAAETGTDPSTRAPIPVGYHFLSGASLAITEPGAPLPGANDWTCRPTADRPRPVVLVHGTLGSGTRDWATYGPLLHNEGYCVYTLTYGATPGAPWPLSELGGVSDIRAVSLPQVAQFVDRVLEATGAEQVD